MKEHKRYPAWLIAISATQAGALLVFMNFAGAMPLLQKDWGLTNSQAGTIQSAGQVGYFLSVLIISSLADYIDPKKLIVGGALWAGLSNLLFARFAQGAISAMALRFFIGLGIAGIYMPGLKLISQKINPEHRGRAVGYFVASFTIGSALSIALSGNLSSIFGWRTAFGVLSIGPFLGAIFSGRLLPPNTLPVKPKEKTRQLKELWTNRDALLVILIYILHAWEVLGLRSWLAAFLAAARANTGVNLTDATGIGALVAGIATVVAAAGTASIGALSDRFSRIKMIKIVMIFEFVFIILLGVSYSISWILVVSLSLVASFIANADSAVISTKLTEVVPEEYLGRALAIYSFLGFTSGSISPIVFGAILDTTSTTTGHLMGSPWLWPFASLAFVSLIGWGISNFMDQRSQVAGQTQIVS